MAVDNVKFTTTVTAAEAIGQYYAFSLNDNKLANTGKEASGITQAAPSSGDDVSIAYIGEARFQAGGAVAAGGNIAVTTSGYFIAQASGYYGVGQAKYAVTSGSVGTGFFNFTRAVYAINSYE